MPLIRLFLSQRLQCQDYNHVRHYCKSAIDRLQSWASFAWMQVAIQRSRTLVRGIVVQLEPECTITVKRSIWENVLDESEDVKLYDRLFVLVLCHHAT